jgi:hypothetical protein
MLNTVDLSLAREGKPVFHAKKSANYCNPAMTEWIVDIKLRYQERQVTA